MSRKLGDKAYESYLNYQAFSSDMPVHQINQTQWYLKFEKDLPGFFHKTDDVFQQMPPLSFFATAERSTLFDFTGFSILSYQVNSSADTLNKENYYRL